jgi:type IV pilus assembly protein PilE
MTRARAEDQMQRTQRGYTLIEAMITVAIVAILTAIALPSYQAYMTRAHRADARAALVQAAQFVERFRAENRGVYTGVALPAGMTTSPAAGRVMYDVAVTAATAATWTLSATPRTGSRMAGDACGTCTLAHDGQRTAAGETSGTQFDACWNR